jgi:transcriptional regulator with PAS, ATPase and Fis domain
MKGRESEAPRLVAPRQKTLIGDDSAFKGAIERARRLARFEFPVMILGETGTGKELMARLIHRHSARSRGVFLPINCAALSESLLLSDLFGHVRGAFTGADRDRAGVFESGRGGTVFLDEIGDLPPAAQGKLLRVLQEGEVRRVGESLPRRVDARIVAATHRGVPRMVAAGDFREDLYYRLSVGTVQLPPLRHRGRDVSLLADHFLSQLGGLDRPRLDPAARRSLLEFSWPGNVRQLKNVLSVAVAVAEGPEILPQNLGLPRTPVEAKSDYHRQVAAFRRRLVEEALEASGGNRAQAARRLGLSRQAISYLASTLLT